MSDWFDPNNLKFILKVARKNKMCVVDVIHDINDVSSFEFLHDDKLWKINHTFNGGQDFMVDFKRQLTKYCRNMENIKSITLRRVNVSDF